MAERDSRRRYRTSAEVLEQLFAMPSDDESVDGMENSDDDETSDTTATSANNAAADDVSDSGETDDDDDILYQLADPSADIDWSDEDFSGADADSCSIRKEFILLVCATFKCGPHAGIAYNIRATTIPLKIMCNLSGGIP